MIEARQEQLARRRSARRRRAGEQPLRPRRELARPRVLPVPVAHQRLVVVDERTSDVVALAREQPAGALEERLRAAGASSYSIRSPANRATQRSASVAASPFRFSSR